MVYAFEPNKNSLSATTVEAFLPSISPWTSIAGVILVGTVGTAFIAASSLNVKDTVKAPASIRPSGDTRLVQSELEGSVKEVLVKENQFVKQGQAIARLNDKLLQIQKAQQQQAVLSAKAELSQVNAQIVSLNAQIAAEKTATEKTISSTKADLSRSQREHQEQQVTTLSSFLTEKANQQKAETDLQKAREDLQFALVDRDRYRELAQTGAVSQRDFEQRKVTVEKAKLTILSEQQSVNIAKSKVQAAQVALDPSEATVQSVRERVAQEASQGEERVAALIQQKQALIQKQIQSQNQINQAQKALQQINSQLQNSTIRATSDGVILKLNLRNSGQVVRAGETVTEIVPKNAPLVIKTLISSNDIKKISVGQTVQLRVDACPHPDYGLLKGSVSTISADTIAQPNAGATPSSVSAAVANRYEVTIKPETLTFGTSDRQCPIQAGMDAKADIVSKEETALQFLLKKVRLIADS